MKLKVGINDWNNQTGNRQSRHVDMFDQAGAEVINIDSSELPHFIWTPVPGLENDVGCPMITQLGGFDSNYVLPSTQKTSPRFEQTFINSDIITVLDPLLWKSIGKRHDDMKVVPLGKPQNFAEDVGDKDDGKFNVLNPMGSMWFKKPEEFIEAVKMVGEEVGDDIHFYLIQKGDNTLQFPAEWLDIDDLTILPQMPFEEIKEYYALADVIAPWSAAEVCPNTTLEGFSLGKPVVSRVMGTLQTISVEYLAELIDDFGMEVGEFDDKWKDKYGSGEGEHYLQADSIDEFVDTILYLYNNQDLEWKGKEWIDNWWDLEERGKCYIDIFKEWIDD